MTPNATIRLPGGAYAGDDPDGFLRKDEIVRHFERWAGSFGAPVREGVTVTSLEAADDVGFTLQTSDGAFRARSVVVCSGAYQRPHRPPGVSAHDVVELDVAGYTNEAALPPGQGARGRQRPDRLPDRGGAARGGQDRRPLVRPRALGTASPGRSRHHPLADRDRVLRPTRGGAAVADGAPDRKRADHRPRRRPRPELPSPPRRRCDPRRALPRRGGRAAPLRHGSRRLGRLRRCAIRRPAHAHPRPLRP